jgi:hypothetical protein
MRLPTEVAVTGCVWDGRGSRRSVMSQQFCQHYIGYMPGNFEELESRKYN